MKKQPLILFILCCFIFTACSLFENGHTSIVNSPIVGKWKWLRTAGGYFGGTVLTPDSPGVSESYLIFGSHHSFSSFSGDTLVGKGKYFLKTKYSNTIINFNPNNYTPPKKMHFLGTVLRVSFSSNGDYLQLHQLCADCYSNYFKRVK